jgi:hypothetical protein
MKLIRVGRRWINLEYLIMGEENDGTPETGHIPAGALRLTLESGKEFDLGDGDADKTRRHMAVFVLPDPAENLVAHDEGPDEGEAPGRRRRKKG